MEWLIRNVAPLAVPLLRAVLPGALMAGAAALVDVGLLDGAVYQALRLALSGL